MISSLAEKGTGLRCLFVGWFEVLFFCLFVLKCVLSMMSNSRTSRQFAVRKLHLLWFGADTVLLQ